MFVVLSIVICSPMTQAQNRCAKLLAAKVFLGRCNAACSTSATTSYSPGDVIRWRIGIANIGYGPLSLCTITDQLPPNFTYLGNCTYSFGAFGIQLNTSSPPCCAMSTAIPSQVGGSFVHQPQMGSSNLVWQMTKLPAQPSGPAEYLVIDFDVLVGSVVEGKYCNSFTATANTQSSYSYLKDTVVTAESNAAQVTIRSGSQGASNSGTGVLNPFLTGTKGNWYPDTSYAYLTPRMRSVNVQPDQTNIRHDGIFERFNVFWKQENANWDNYTTNWQWVESISKKDVNGLTVETKDVLARYNSLVTGFKNKLVVAEASNARSNEVLFEGYEDWNYLPVAAYCDTTITCVPDAIDWHGVFEHSTKESHSGRASGLLVGEERTLTVDLMPKESTATAGRGEKCVGVFAPTGGMKYVVSAWVRDNADPLATSFDVPKIFINGVAFRTTGNVIDGWQQITGAFDLPSSATSMTISFTGGTGSTWYDDIRIFPFDAKLVTHSYDGNSQKLTYTNDENNYFTKYNYDASDNLESINKETEKGVMTIKESRTGMVKRP